MQLQEWLKRNEIAYSQTKVNADAMIIPWFQQHWENMTCTSSCVGVGTSASSAFPDNLVMTISCLINTVPSFICLNHLGLPLQSSPSPKQCSCFSSSILCFIFQTHPDVITTASKGTGQGTLHRLNCCHVPLLDPTDLLLPIVPCFFPFSNMWALMHILLRLFWRSYF